MGWDWGICVRVHGYGDEEEMNVTVDIDILAEKYYWMNTNKFHKGHTYHLSELMEELGLEKGTPQGKPRGNTK